MSVPAQLVDPNRSVVLLVDLQERVMRAIHHAERVVTYAALLADVAALLEIPILVAEQNPKGLGHSLPNLSSRATETIATQSFDACVDGAYDRLVALRGIDRPDVVLAGCETHIGVLHTVLGLRARGCRVWVPADACGARSPLSDELADERMRQVGASVSTVETVAYGWLRTSAHPRFKDVQTLVKAASLPDTRPPVRRSGPVPTLVDRANDLLGSIVRR